MKQSLVRSAIAGAIGGLVVGLAVAALLAQHIKDVPGKMSAMAILAIVAGSIAAVLAAGFTFAFSQYPHSARNAAIVATLICLAAMAALRYLSREMTTPPGTTGYVVSWMLLWPVSFGSSLWGDLKLYAWKRIEGELDPRVRRRGSGKA